jgi:hypothetical protein
VPSRLTSDELPVVVDTAVAAPHVMVAARVAVVKLSVANAAMPISVYIFIICFLLFEVRV